MRPPPPPIPRVLHVAALATALLFLGLIARFWHPAYGFTAFFQLDASNDAVKLSPFKALPVYVYRDTGGYDGLYYAQLALDPSLRDPALPAAMDNLSYRARRILPPAFAWALGLGNPARIIAAYSVLNVAAWLALAALLWPVLGRHGWRGWFAWIGVLFSAGALCSVRLALTDLVAATLLTAGIIAAERQRKYSALMSVALGALARETSFLGIAGLVKPPWFSGKNAARLALAALPLAAWLVYVRFRVGPADAGWGNFSWPFVGLLEKWRNAAVAAWHHDDPLLAWTTFLATIGLTTQAAFFATRRAPCERWWRVGVAYSVLMLCLGTAVWEGFPGAATRVLLPLSIAFAILVCRARAGIAWLLVGNLTVCSGLLVLRDIPHDPTEITAARSGATAGIVHVGAGWYEAESSSRHHWHWAAQAGKLEVEAWPRSRATLRLQFALRSLTPRTVVLRIDGRECWRGEIGPRRSEHHADLTIDQGHAGLEFASDTAPVPESAAPNARPLGFALYDVSLTVPNQ